MLIFGFLIYVIFIYIYSNKKLFSFLKNNNIDIGY